MDERTRVALLRALVAFVAVLLIGSGVVFAVETLRDTGETVAPTPSTSASPSPTTSPGEGRPTAWLAWVPGGVPDGFGAQLTSVPSVATTTTETADIAWLTGSTAADGTVVDAPEAPQAIPIDVTGVEPAFATFIPQPFRTTVADLADGEAILSETAANQRGLGPDATLTFDTGVSLQVVATLPDVYMGGFEVLTSRATGETIGVTHERYVLFEVKEGLAPDPAVLAARFVPYLPEDAPFPEVEVRAPFTTRFLRQNDRELPPMLLKQRFGEFTAIHNPGTGEIDVDPTWIEAHIESRALPVLGSVTCHEKALALLERAMEALVAADQEELVQQAGDCFAPNVDPGDPAGLLTSRDFGASIDLNQPDNPVGEPPTNETQPPALVKTMYKAGFGWGGKDAWPQGALFRYRRTVKVTG
ncbi:MAG TPA: hypothetical protein VF235_09250 [Actinomycetota bacterium]